MDVHFLSPSQDFIGISYQNRIQCTVLKNAKSLNIEDLQQAQKGAYKPAYKKYPETAGSQLQDMPSEVAEIVAVWPDLPVHIKAAIKALIHTCDEGVE